MGIRRGQEADEALEQSNEMAAYETNRSAAESGAEKAPKKDEEHISVFWRVFGGTILSICALISINIFNNVSSSIAELRAAVGREHDARAEMVKKDEFNSRLTSQYERMRAVDAIKVELEGMKERVSANTAATDALKRDTALTLEAIKKDAATNADAIKRDATALDVLKERVVQLEGIKKDFAGLDSLKEKILASAADLKALRDEAQKLRTDVDRNNSYDLERKSLRDSQHKQVDDALKELQKGLQDCREKLARLEGAQPKPETPSSRATDPSRAKPAAKPPAKPGEVKPAGGDAEPGATKPAGDETP